MPRAFRLLFLATLFFTAAFAHAGNPAHPILFVTQAPVPEEVNTRQIDVSFMSTFSMTIGAPSGPGDTNTYLFQVYAITLPSEAQLNANAKPVVTVVPGQPAYDNVFPIDAPANLTDGLLVHYLFGLRYTALTAGVAGAGATRDAMQIETYLSGLTP